MKRQFCTFLALGLGLTLAGEGAGMGWHAASDKGVVAAGGAGSVQAGLEILEADGNAADAAAAVILALAVTDFGPFCIGGEAPLMIYSAKLGKVEVLSGQGAAPRLATLSRFREMGGIPRAWRPNNLANAAVPAIIDLCVTVLQRHGTKRFADVVKPTLRLLETGRKPKPWYGDLARTLRRLTEAEAQAGADRNQGLRAVSDRFYRGDVADELDAWYREAGGLLRKADLAAHVTHVEEPVTVQYRGYTVVKCGSWTQGPYMLQTLRLLEDLDLSAMGHLSADYIHAVTEAMKLGLADRDAYYGDPLCVNVPLAALLSDEYTALRRPLLDLRRASRDVRPGDPLRMQALAAGAGSAAKDGTSKPSDTTTCVVADRWGNVVATTPSGWGSRAGPGGGTGITHGTRLISLNTVPGHPNAVAPGKRPRITLTPTIVLKDNKPVLAISVVGGDLQDQVSLQLLLDYVEFGMRPKDAVTAPRFSTGHHTGSFSQTRPRKGSLTLYPQIAAETAAELRSRGHGVSIKKRGVLGHPVMLWIDQQTGVLHAAGDPKAGRHAGAVRATVTDAR